MKGTLTRRLALARERTPTVPDPKAMTPKEKRAHAFRLLDFNTQVALMNRQAEAEGQAPWQIMKRERAREQELAQAAASAAPEPKPAPATTPKPSRPRHVGEPDPDFVPPQNQFWEERCWFRAREAQDFYDDEPERNDDDWEW